MVAGAPRIDDTRTDRFLPSIPHDGMALVYPHNDRSRSRIAPPGSRGREDLGDPVGTDDDGGVIVNTEYESKTRPDRCPACAEPRVARILYGYPHMDAELRAQLDRGDVVLGGCCVSDRDLLWRCVSCGAPIFQQDDLPAK